MDAWMDRVTGFQHLQKADSQAPTPGVPPKQRLLGVEALMGRPAACKRPGDVARASHGTAAPGQMGTPEAAQHVGQVYSHLPHTEPSYPKQDGKEQKQRVSEPTAQAGAGPPGPRRRGRYSDGRVGTLSPPPSGKHPGSRVCACVRVFRRGGHEAVNPWSSGTLRLSCPGPGSGEGTPD